MLTCSHALCVYAALTWTCFSSSRGEYIIDSINSVEDTKGEEDSLRHSYLRVVSRPQ